MPKFEGKTEIGGLVLAVQDEQLMLYFPEGEGTSVPLTQEVVEKLTSLALLAKLYLEGMNG